MNEEMNEIREALEAAAQSLEAIAGLAGKDECLLDNDQVRGYAMNRAMEARKALSSPHPEAREEDKAIAKLVEEWGQVCIIADKRGVCVQYETGDDDFLPPFASHKGKTLTEALEASGALSRLAAPKPEGPSSALRTASAERLAARNALELIHDIGLDRDGETTAEKLGALVDEMTNLAQKGLKESNGAKPAAPEPRPAEEPFATSKDSLQVELAPSEEALVEKLAGIAYEAHMRTPEGYRAMIDEMRTALRSQLARKDEGLREALERLVKAVRSQKTDGIESPRSMAVNMALAQADIILGEPDGRKGE